MLEKQCNAELTEALKKQRRAAAQVDAEAAGREHKHRNEIQELKKVLHYCPTQLTVCNAHGSNAVVYAESSR